MALTVVLGHYVAQISDIFRVRIMIHQIGSGDFDQKLKARKIAYAAILMWLALLAMVLGGVDWLGSAQVHTEMETVASMLAFVAGISLLARFYTSKNRNFLWIGTAFMGAAFLDAYHVLVTSGFFSGAFPSVPASLGTWSGTASRLFLSFMILLSWIVWRFGASRLGKARDYEVYIGVSVFTLLVIVVISTVSLPRTYLPGSFLHRPEELAPALFFILAFAGYVRKGEWKTDDFEHWIAIFLLVGAISQLGFMSLSWHMFDPRFDIAHVLKIVGYLAVVTGLFIDYFHFFKRLTYQEEELKESISEQLRIGNENAAVTGIARVIGSTLDIEEVYRRMAEQVKGVVPWDYLSISIADDDGQFRNRFLSGVNIVGHGFGDVLSVEGTIIEELLEKRHTIYFNARSRKQVLRNYPHLLVSFEHGMKSYIAAPFISNDKVIGIISMQSARQHAYTHHHSSIMERMRAEIVGAIANSILFEQVKQSQEDLKAHGEDLARSNAELEQFAYVASHDLQTPLRSVAGLTRILEEDYHDQLDEDATELMDLIVAEVTRMQVLINSLLAFSRVGRNADDNETSDCAAIVNQELTGLQVAIEETNAEVIIDELPEVIADSALLGQIFRNLIGNALKYQAEDPPKVRVSAVQGDDEWVFSVSDNGIGIDPKYSDRIFLMFQRLHKQGEYSGAGIGLSICKKAVDRIGGRIWVESEFGAGATFCFSVPKKAYEQSDEPTSYSMSEQS